MNSIVNEQLQDYLRQLSKSDDETILELEEFAKNNHIPIVEAEVRQLLKMILLMEQPKSILEIGTAIGYSSIIMKKTCPDAKITTVENYEKMQILPEKTSKSTVMMISNWYLVTDMKLWKIWIQNLIWYLSMPRKDNI